MRCVLAAIAALCPLLAGCNSVNFADGPTRSGVVFVGDSIFGRWDLDAYFPGKNCVNAGLFGKRTDEIRAIFPDILSGKNVCHGFQANDPQFPLVCVSIPPPRKVVIFLGWNNLLQAKDPKMAVEDLRAMTEAARAQGVDVVLLVPYRYDSAWPAAWMQPWDPCSLEYPYRDAEPILNSGIEDIGIQLRVREGNLEWLFSAAFGCQSNYTIDGIHPNASGYQLMHDFILPLL